jgi:AbrB family looped-hinge helix DNA binding protein
MQTETIKLGKRGTVVIPAHMRERYGFKEGSLVSVETKPEGLLLRPMVAVPVEKYTPEQKARFLLVNTVTKEDYTWAAKEVRKMGLDPDKITGVEGPKSETER